MPTPIRPEVAGSPDYPFEPVHAPVKLDQNESPEDFPQALKDEVLTRLRDLPWHRYPDLHAERVCAALAAHEHWPQDGVVATTGSNVLIALLTQLGGLGRRVMTVEPNFSLYALDARLLGVPVTEVALRPDLTLDHDAVIAALRAPSTAGSDPRGVLFLPQPHAPTGSMAALEQVEAIVEASTGWLVVLDEAYHHFAGTDLSALARRHENLVLLRTFSKAWGLAGARLGYALSHAAVASGLRKLAPPFALSTLQAVVADVALAHPQVMRERVARIVAERERVFLALQRHPHWQPFPSRANFLLVRTPDAAAAHRQLLDRGVLVRRQDSLPGLHGCLRVTIGTPQENDAFLRAAGVGPAA